MIAQRLLEGGANPMIRNQITGWVPLHEAAWNGNIDCAKILLQWDAPVMSRTPKVNSINVPASRSVSCEFTYCVRMINPFQILSSN